MNVENRTVRSFKRIAIEQDSESEPEFKKQNLKELQTDECNITHKAHTSAKIDDKVKKWFLCLLRKWYIHIFISIYTLT